MTTQIRGVPQRLMLVLMLFNVVINDLKSRLNKNLITYSFYSKLVAKLEEKGVIQTDLKRLYILKEHVLKVRYDSRSRNGRKYIPEKRKYEPKLFRETE